MAIPVTEVTPAWQNYIDVANDVKRWLQIPATDTTRDNDLQDLTDAACTWVQEQLGQPVAPTTFFRRFNGYSNWGGAHIVLPYYPILGVPTVTEYWGASGFRTDPNCVTTQDGATVTDTACVATDVGAAVAGPGMPTHVYPQILSVNPGVSFTMDTEAISSGTNTLTISKGHPLVLQTVESQGNSDMFTLEPLKGWIIRSYLGLLARPTFPGLKNIEVTWVAGRNPIPPTIRLATREHIKFWWNNTQQASLGAPVGFGDPGSASPTIQDWPAVEARIKAMLRPYMQVGVA